MYAAKIVADSISPDGTRLTTMEVTFPRIVLAEFNTHRVFSRNSASARAIPFAVTSKRILEAPFVPEEWGSNKPGMQAGGSIADPSKASEVWLEARDHALDCAARLHELGVHKQLVNRLLEPFMWHTVLVTSTEWENFLNLRCHPDAQPQIQIPARMMRDALSAAEPVPRSAGDWHLPLVSDEEREGHLVAELRWISAGRCARVSYLTHYGVRDTQADIDLAFKLVAAKHMSPFEHQASPLTHGRPASTGGNLRGWMQFRKMLDGESVFRDRP
jgi:hypothetical protein